LSVCPSNIGIAFRESDGEGTNVAGYDGAPVGLAIFSSRARIWTSLSLSNAGFLVIERLAHIVEISTGTNADMHAEKGEKTERGRGK
jgi:hypothetical protein